MEHTEEDFDDIEWESNDKLQDAASSGTNEAQAIELNPEDPAANVKKNTPPRKRLKEEDYQIALERASLNIQDRLDYVCKLCRLSGEGYLGALMQSLLPPALLTAPPPPTSSSSSYSSSSSSFSSHSNEYFRALFAWMRSEFTLVASEEVTAEEGRDGSASLPLLEQVLRQRGGCVAQAHQLLFALLSSTGVRCRLVFALPLCSLHPRQEREEEGEDSRPALLSWLEIPTQNSWEVLDLQAVSAGDVLNIEKRMGRSRRNFFVVALEEVGDDWGAEGRGAAGASPPLIVTDLTARYCKKVVGCNTKRLMAQYEACRSTYEQQLRALSSPLLPPLPSLSGTVIDLTTPHPFEQVLEDKSSEEAALRRLRETQSRELPRTLQELRSHPLYVVQRHLLADEVLHPSKKKVVALIKGEAVYERASVAKLKSKIQWRREMRQVRPGEEAVKGRKKRRVTGADEETGEGGSVEIVEIKLFGEWQTEALVVPPVEEGLIPRNRFGNLEIWDEMSRYVPQGAVYVSSPVAERAAKFLGIQYVPAVTGFESRGGRAVPLMGGVVVLREQEMLLRDTIFNLEAVKDEEQYNKRDKLLVMRWQQIVGSMLRRERLREEYGH